VAFACRPFGAASWPRAASPPRPAPLGSQRESRHRCTPARGIPPFRVLRSGLRSCAASPRRSTRCLPASASAVPSLSLPGAVASSRGPRSPPPDAQHAPHPGGHVPSAAFTQVPPWPLRSPGPAARPSRAANEPAPAPRPETGSGRGGSAVGSAAALACGFHEPGVDAGSSSGAFKPAVVTSMFPPSVRAAAAVRPSSPRSHRGQPPPPKKRDFSLAGHEP